MGCDRRCPAVLEMLRRFRDGDFRRRRARRSTAVFATSAPSQNEHRRQILDVTMRLPVSGQRHDRRRRDHPTVLEKLDVVGVLCVEFFLTHDGELLINELAPRPHNSGHYTFDACVTSQFEQQLRAVCGLPLGSTEQLCPAAMANLLGDLWSHGEPDWAAACAFPGVKLHLYGKMEAAARPQDGPPDRARSRCRRSRRRAREALAKPLSRSLATDALLRSPLAAAAGCSNGTPLASRDRECAAASADRLHAAQRELALTREVDRIRQDPQRLRRGVEAHRVLRFHIVQEELRFALEVARQVQSASGALPCAPLMSLINSTSASIAVSR